MIPVLSVRESRWMNLFPCGNPNGWSLFFPYGNPNGGSLFPYGNPNGWSLSFPWGNPAGWSLSSPRGGYSEVVKETTEVYPITFEDEEKTIHFRENDWNFNVWTFLNVWVYEFGNLGISEFWRFKVVGWMYWGILEIWIFETSKFRNIDLFWIHHTFAI